MKPPSTARTAGRSDWAERRFRRQPFILLSFSSSEKPQKRRKRSHTNVSNTLAARPSTPPAQTPQRSFQGAAAGTHATPASNRAHSGSHGETRGVSDGVVSLPSARSARSRTSPGRVSERRTLPLLGLGRVCFRRTQKAFGTAMRLCASLFRGVAAPLGCVIFLLSSKFRFVLPAIRAFRVCETWGYHYPRRALRVLETPDGRLSKRLICRFLRSGGRSSPLDSYFLANTQNFLLAVPVANTFALWYDKFDKLELSN